MIKNDSKCPFCGFSDGTHLRGCNSAVVAGRSVKDIEDKAAREERAKKKFNNPREYSKPVK